MNKFLPLVVVAAIVLSGCMTTRIPDLSETMVSPGEPSAIEPKKEVVYVGQTATPYKYDDNLEKHTLSFVDLDIRQALAILSRLSNAQIVAEPDVSGTVNLSAENKTIAEILMTIAKQSGYSVFIEDEVIVVGKPRMITRAFYLNYLRDKRASKSVTNASISSTSGSSGNGGSTSSEQGNVTVTTSGDTDFWKELKEGLQQIVFGGASSGDQATSSNSSGKKIVVNDMTGVVYVTDTEKNMEIVSSFLKDIDKELKRQVLIQAHIVEVDLDNEFSLGIDWSGVLNSGSVSTTVTQGLLPTTQSGVFTLNIADAASDFSAMLDAFKEQGHVNMLSSPKISTMNNQKAVIKLTTKEVTWVNETTFNSSGDVLTTSTTPQIDEVGLFLDVTPNINADGVVTMHVHPSISEIKAISESPDGTSSKPIIDIREVDTMAEVKSGETVVIAGLIVDRTRETKRSVPLLGDLPFVGLAFSNFKQELKKTELVIFLTPYVLESQSMSKIRKQHEERLRRLEELSSFIESRSKESAIDSGPKKQEVMMFDASDPDKGMVDEEPLDRNAAGISQAGPLHSEVTSIDEKTSSFVAGSAEGWSTSLPRRSAGAEKPASWEVSY